MSWVHSPSGTIRPFMVALAASALLVANAPAQHGDHDQPQHASVLNVIANLATGQLTIYGNDFPRQPVVVLDGQGLTIVSCTSTTIVADLPSAVVSTPGSYALTLERPRHAILTHFVVTVGAVGPPGPMGPQGGAARKARPATQARKVPWGKPDSRDHPAIQCPRRLMELHFPAESTGAAERARPISPTSHSPPAPTSCMP